jgi:hypothetical protein
MYLPAANTLGFSTNGTKAVTIDGSQNVGIGVTPLTALTFAAGATISWGSSLGSIDYVQAGSGSLALGTNGTQKAVIDTSGNVGVGVTPSVSNGGKTFSIGSSVGNTVRGQGINDMNIDSNAIYNSGWIYANTGYSTRYVCGNGNSGQHVWYNAPSGTAGNAITFTQAMTLDASGNWLAGNTTASPSSGSGVKFLKSFDGVGDDRFSTVCANSTNTTTPITLYSTGAGSYRFYVGAGGTIYATSTSITAISDQTLKTNIRDLETGLTQVLALRPRRFDWINGDATDVAGFVAQEVAEVLPDLVDDYRYNTDEEGNDIIKKSLKMGDILPTLVKAIQEQQALITNLTERLVALEGK